jgi:hypothetical protein
MVLIAVKAGFYLAVASPTMLREVLPGQEWDRVKLNRLASESKKGVSSSLNPYLMVARGRIELPTRGFSIRCSTN